MRLRNPRRARIPQRIKADVGNEMKRREQIYTVVALIWGVLNFVVVAQILFLFPKTNPGFNHFLAAVFALLGTVLVAASVTNLACKRLTFVGTVVQIAFLILIVPVGTAFAIWGIWLLRKAKQEGVANTTSEDIVANRAESSR